MRIVAIILLSIGALLASAAFYWEVQFMHHGPTRPNPENGSIYANKIRGNTVYLTRNEDLVQNWMFGVGAIVWICGGACFARSRPKTKFPGIT